MSLKFKALAVDDDELVLSSIEMSQPDNWEFVCCKDFNQIPYEQKFHTALVDMHLKGNLEVAEGIDVIKKLKQHNPHIDIVAMSGDLNRDLMEKSLLAGAERFLAKPLNPEELKLTIEKIEAHLLLQQATTRSQKHKVNLIGSSQAAQEIRKTIASMKNEDGPILIEGESGTGKEVVAEILAQQNPGGPSISVNVAAIPENLFESEFFGHQKGAFTGAEQNKMGLAEAANGGTLFIDEIEALSLNMQVKLLRFLENGEIKRVGANNTINIKTRVIVATNKNLETMVKANEFRDDLLWRINGKKITLPPLRERKEDIQELCQFFLDRDPVRRKQISPEALQSLQSYSWPGNIRELKRCCELLILNSPLPIIREQDVHRIMSPQSETPVVVENLEFTDGLPQLVARYEAKLIESALEKYKDVDEVARILKISRSSLYKKIKDHGINWRS